MATDGCYHDPTDPKAHNGELIADELDRRLAHLSGTAIEAGEPADHWRGGIDLLEDAISGVRRNCLWGPDERALVGREQHCLVAVRVLAAVTLMDFQAGGPLRGGLLVLHHCYDMALRGSAGAGGARYRPPGLEAPAQPRIPDLPRLALGAPARLSQAAVRAAAGTLRSAQHMAVEHLEEDAAAHDLRAGAPVYRRAFDAAIATAIEIAESCLDDESGGYRDQVWLLRDGMADMGDGLAAWAGMQAAAGVQLYAHTHAAVLRDGYGALPDIERDDTVALEAIAFFFHGVCDEVRHLEPAHASPDFLAATSLRAHFGGMARAAATLPPYVRAAGSAFVPRSPDIHTIGIMARLAEPDDREPHSALVRLGAESFSHGQVLVADAMAGAAASLPAGDERDALLFGAAQTVFRCGQVSAVAAGISE